MKMTAKQGLQGHTSTQCTDTEAQTEFS